MKKKQWIVIGTVFLMVFGICLFLGMRKAWNHSSNEREQDENAVQNGDGSQESRGVARTGQVFDPEASDLKAVDGFAVSPEKDMTIMIYMIGSNLESNMGKATSDLEEISNSGYDAQNLNVIVYTGGSRRWTGGVPNNKNCVLDMGRASEERIVAQTAKNADMGAPGTLSDFVNFCDAYYPAKRHGLILWDHGGGPLLGYGADELFEYDSLLLSEMQAAMQKTHYANTNKLDFVGFDACIMACIENMNIWTEYADYFIGSEELEPGDGWDYAFLKLVKPGTKTQEICEGVVDFFEQYYKAIVSDVYHPDLTLCCVDLKKLTSLNNSIDAFSGKCRESVKSGGYSQIVISRSTTKGLAKAAESEKDGGMDSYDIIDVWDMAEKFKWIGESEADGLMKGIERAIVKSYTNVEDLHGISIYFPFGNKSQYRARQNDYDDVVVSSNYRSFLQEASGEWLAERQAGWKLAEPKEDENGHYVELTQEQAENIVSASFSLITRSDFFGYIPLLVNISIKPDKNGRLYLPEDIRLLLLGDSFVCSAREIESSGARSLYVTEGLRVTDNPLFSSKTMTGTRRQNVQAMIIQKGDELILQSINAEDENIISSGKSTIDLGLWTGLEIRTKGVLPLRDVDGQLLPISQWPDSGTIGWRGGISTQEMEFAFQPLDSVAVQCMAQLQVEDIYGDVYASELILLDYKGGAKSKEVQTPEGKLSFSVYDDHVVCTTYYGDEIEVKIPDMVDGRPVTMIGNYAFSGNNNVSPHKSLKKVILPSSLKQIGACAFCDCSALREAELPEGLEKIGAGAFVDCISLNVVELPASLTDIDIGVFAGCSSLSEIRIRSGNQSFSVVDGALYSKNGKILYAYPAAKTGRFTVAEGTEEIACAAFLGSKITKVALPVSLRKIDEFAFYDSALTTPPVFPERLSLIGSNAFSILPYSVKRENVSSEQVVIKLGANVKTIGVDAFDLFTARTFEVASNNPYFSSVGGNLMSKTGDTLLCFALRKENVVIVPEGTVEFGNESLGFRYKQDYFGNTKTHIEIPDTVSRFPGRLVSDRDYYVIHANTGSNAESFAKKRDIALEYTLGNSLLALGSGELTIESGKLRYELYQDHAVIVYCEVPKAKDGGKVVIKLPSEIEGKPVTVIGNGSWDIFSESKFDFNFLRKCDKLIIPEGVTTISDNAIARTEEIQLPSSLAVIGSNAINLLGSDTFRLSIPENVESLGKAFVTGPVAEKFMVTPALKYIAPGAFSGCEGLKEFVISDDVTGYSVKEGMLYSADGTTLLAVKEGVSVIPEGTVKIAESVFRGRNDVKKISLPKSLEEIASYAFAECKNLEKLEYPKDGNLCKIGSYAFSQCDALKEAVLPDTVTEMGEYVFYNCQGLQSASIPKGIIVLPIGTYGGCRNLTEVVFSDQLMRIERFAFSYCDSLREIRIPKSVREISYSVFTSDPCVTFAVDPENPYFDVLDGFLVDVRLKKLLACPGGISGVVKVPEGIINVESVFYNEKEITDLYLPSSVIWITGVPMTMIDGKYQCPFVLHGTKNSYVERYAYENGIEFRGS